LYKQLAPGFGTVLRRGGLLFGTQRQLYRDRGPGIDIQGDYITLTGNGIIMRFKTAAGSKHAIISNNQFSRVDLYCILLAFGRASYYAVESKGQIILPKVQISTAAL
jgi:hypothetical protein